MTRADPTQFIVKDKLITYIEACVELYKYKNLGQVYEIYKIVELEK